MNKLRKKKRKNRKKNITFKILCAKNRRKNLHKHPGPTVQIRPGPGYFSRARKSYSVHYGLTLTTMYYSGLLVLLLQTNSSTTAAVPRKGLEESS